MSPLSTTPLSTFLQNIMTKRSTLTIGSAFAIIAIFLAGYGLHSPAVPQAEASLPSEATALGASISKDIADFKHGQSLVDEGNDIMQRSSLAARGKDLQLCAEYKLIFNRATKKLETSPDCAKATSDTQPSFQ